MKSIIVILLIELLIIICRLIKFEDEDMQIVKISVICFLNGVQFTILFYFIKEFLSFDKKKIT